MKLTVCKTTVCAEVSEESIMSSLEMTGVMGILAAWETDGREVHQGLNATINGLFQSGNICGAPASFITLARYPGLQGRGEFYREAL